MALAPLSASFLLQMSLLELPRQCELLGMTEDQISSETCWKKKTRGFVCRVPVPRISEELARNSGCKLGGIYSS